MPRPASPATDPRQVLVLSRILWAALLGGVLLIGLTMGVIMKPPGNTGETGDTLLMLVILAMILPLVTIPIGLFARGQLFKAGWVGDVVKPDSYLKGTIVALACCEGPAMFGIVAYFVTQNPLAIIPVALCVAVMLMLWPNGRAMLPRPDADESNPYRAMK